MIATSEAQAAAELFAMSQASSNTPGQFDRPKWQS
jgi:hypothetical protein